MAGAVLNNNANAFTRAANTLPAWRGFNLRDFNTPNPARNPFQTKREHLMWMRDWGFDFIRLPMAYPYYLDIDRTRPINADDVYRLDTQAMDRIEQFVLMAQGLGLHVSLNLHRAPGYCINAGFREPFNLWKDTAAREAFNYHWGLWAKRFKNISREKISFDLLNEPAYVQDMNDQHSSKDVLPVDLYREVVEGATKAIRAENKDHLIIADGNRIGNDPVPELAPLKIAQSCRGYFPHAISHYKAPWANKEPDKLPVPKYPGQTGNQYFDRASLEKYYAPWVQLVKSGVGVHCGECGAWRKTPHEVALAWLSDVTGILSSHHIGFALWEFSGDFGILNSGREDVAYEDWHGYRLDRKMLDIIRKA